MLTDQEIEDIGEEHAPYVDHKFARAIESAATAPLLARIAELEKDVTHKAIGVDYWKDKCEMLERQLEEARKQMEAQKDEWLSWEAKRKDLEQDAEMLDWLDKQNADIENDAWVVLAHDCAGDEDCKKYWVGADLRGAIRAAIKEQT